LAICSKEQIYHVLDQAEGRFLRRPLMLS